MDERKAIKMLMKFFSVLVVIMLIVHLSMTIVRFFPYFSMRDMRLSTSI